MTAAAATPVSAVIGQIERDLQAVWVAGPGEAAKSRVCTMNLVVVAGSPRIADDYTHIVDQVTSSIPARAIVVALDPDAPDGLHGDVSAVCGVGDDATCSERVRLTVAGATCARTASIVDALRVPELPTMLLWLGRVHVTDPVFVGLAAEAQRVILDTEYTSLGSLVQLARWARESPTRPQVADLAWTRLGTWQELCARFFDAPALTPQAHAVRSLALTQASDPGERLGSEGGLLLGWLATRLGWELHRVGGKLRLLRHDGEPIALRLGAVRRPEGVPPDALAGIAIETELEGARGSFTIDRELGSGPEGQTPDADLLVWRSVVGSGRAQEQRVRLSSNKGARMLERTLRRPAHDPALAESARFAEEIDEEGLVCT